MQFACRMHDFFLYLFVRVQKGRFNILRYSYTLHKTDFSAKFLVFLLLLGFPDVPKWLDTPE